jgi:hypothetical protein
MQASIQGKSLPRIAQIAWLAIKNSAFWAPRRSLPGLASPLLLVGLALLDLAAVEAAGYLAAPAGSSFDAAGLPSACAGLALILVLTALFSRFFLAATRLIDLIGVAFATLFVIDAVWALLQLWPSALDRIDAEWPVSLPLSGVMAPWIGVAIGMLLGAQTRSTWRAFLVAFCAVFAIGIPTAMLDRGAPAWLAPEAQEANATEAPGEALHLDETMLYGESERLAQVLEHLSPRTAGRVNVYFIGFAGNGEQSVFSHEVSYVKEMFERRFAAAGHSIALMNNQSTPGRLPLATATSLQQALSAVGQRMSADDVVVLFLSSHGSRESGVNVELPPFEFEDIDPDMLAAMFKEAHIRQRVVIVSTCFAGIFVPALANPDTLVITAADATHTSFGCSNEADFTYFGEAYFHDALLGTNSFAAAFQQALPLIRERESEQGFEHSNPQMVMGANIKRTLARLEAQLQAQDASPNGASRDGSAAQ